MTLTFFDFCSGIGSSRLGLEQAGMTCVGHSEISDKAIQLYNIFYKDEEKNYGDLKKIIPEKLPDFDLLIAGFPCQSFSSCGDQKGFNDENGQIIFYLIEILKKKKINYFILENVSRLLTGREKQNLNKILQELNKAGYYVNYELLNTTWFGIPHNRNRVFFTGVRKEKVKSSKRFFEFFLENKIVKKKPKPLRDFLVSENNFYFDQMPEKCFIKLFERIRRRDFNLKKNLSIKKLLKTEYLAIYLHWGRLFQYSYYAFSTIVHDAKRERYLYTKKNSFRYLTGYEGMLLQGFPVEYAKLAEKNIKSLNLLKLTGNAMTVNVVNYVAKKLLKFIEEEK